MARGKGKPRSLAWQLHLVYATLAAKDVLLAKLPVRVIVGQIYGPVPTRLIHGLMEDTQRWPRPRGEGRGGGGGGGLMSSQIP